jgi:hypothetical protein
MAAIVLFSASPTYPQGATAGTGPFAAWAGSWAGNGVATNSDGVNERVRCTVKYVSESGGHTVQIDLRCASDSYSAQFTGSIVETGDSLSGNWFESTRRIGGKISGRASSHQIDARADGETFTALLTVITQGTRQSFSMESPGAKMSKFSVTLNRAAK